MTADVNTVIELAVLALVAASGTGVVLTRDPFSQTIGLSFFGLMLALMFLVLQAPDVALSQLAVGAVALPLMVLLALARIRRQEVRRDHDKSPQGDAPPPQEEKS